MQCVILNITEESKIAGQHFTCSARNIHTKKDQEGCQTEAVHPKA